MMMTETLEKAFEEASKLPSSEQDELGSWILEEIESEGRWERLIGSSKDTLENLADEALDEHRSGGSQDLDSLLG
jgi:hypothetical protein